MSNPKRQSFRAAAQRLNEAPPELPAGEPVVEPVLTQMGKGEEFREEPRWELELDVSAVCGQHGPDETTRAVFGRVKKGWSVRHLNVARLTAAEYRSLHSPTRRNPQHASITAPIDSEDVEFHRVWWQAPERVRLKTISEQRELR